MSETERRVETNYTVYYVAIPHDGEYILCRDPDTNTDPKLMKPRRWTTFIEAYTWADDAKGIVIAKEVSYGHPPGVMLNSDDKDEILL